ncbi:MAG: hypothetical protein ACRD1C_13685 [Terriglobales bacterium]
MLQPGDVAPPLTATDHGGQPRTLADISGPRGLVLLLYRGYW